MHISPVIFIVRVSAFGLLIVLRVLGFKVSSYSHWLETMDDSSAIKLGRIRPLIRLCRDGSCPCANSTCALHEALIEYEKCYGSISDELAQVREDARQKLQAMSEVSDATTVPGFICIQAPATEEPFDLDAFKV